MTNIENAIKAVTRKFSENEIAITMAMASEEFNVELPDLWKAFAEHQVKEKR